MAGPDYYNYNHFDKEGYYDHETWTPICRTCLRAISSSRPPVYNADNCSCEDFNGTQVPQPAASPGQGFQYQPNDAVFRRPNTYASSTASAPGQEGLEKEAPNLQVGNSYLPIAPEMGLNEPQHRRSASMYSNRSFQLERFLADLRKNQPRQDISIENSSTFLSQMLHIRSQAAEKKAKHRKRSERSYHSLGTSSSEEYGFVIGADDLARVAHAGDWADERIRDTGYEMELSISTDDYDG